MLKNLKKEKRSKDENKTNLSKKRCQKLFYIKLFLNFIGYVIFVLGMQNLYGNNPWLGFILVIMGIIFFLFSKNKLTLPLPFFNFQVSKLNPI